MSTWPAHSALTEPWAPAERRGSRADRTLKVIEVSVPPFISDLSFDPVGEVGRAHDAALIAVATLEAGYGRHLAPLADFLLRTESVASSKIEHIDAGWSAFGKALVGARASSEAQSQLAAVRALTDLVEAAGRGPITRAGILDAHRLLMSPDYCTVAESGQFRSVQNWIGGSDYTPINALFVPSSNRDLSPIRGQNRSARSPNTPTRSSPAGGSNSRTSRRQSSTRLWRLIAMR